MPELPEVETVRRALAPAMVGARFEKIICHRPDLRFALPTDFARRLVQTRVCALTRRGKYMLADLSSRETLIMHLGMSGRFTLKHHQRALKPPGPRARHDHVEFVMVGAGSEKATVTLIYNDPRRFGFMDLVASEGLEDCRHFADMGPEPLGNGFSALVLQAAFEGRKTLVKQALLDQRIVAGLGNIYVCEALFRAGISPKRRAGNISPARIARLAREIRLVLEEAIEAGGASLRDFASCDGSPGYFQHEFRIYGHEGAPCQACGHVVRRIVQSGRSTFYCARCQR